MECFTWNTVIIKNTQNSDGKHNFGRFSGEPTVITSQFWFGIEHENEKFLERRPFENWDSMHTQIENEIE